MHMHMDMYMYMYMPTAQKTGQAFLIFFFASWLLGGVGGVGE